MLFFYKFNNSFFVEFIYPTFSYSLDLFFMFKKMQWGKVYTETFNIKCYTYSLIKNNLIIYLNKKHLDSKILQNKFLCIYHNFTMEYSLPQIINTKHTKTACSCRVSVQYINRKTLQFYKGCFTNFNQIKA